MDVEKTIEFLLENQARLQAMVEAEADRAKAEAERAKADTERAKEDAGRVKDEMAAIRQILQDTAFIQQEQARVLVRHESNLSDLAESHRRLADAQQVTETKLQALLEALRRGANGGSNGSKQ